jgi:hypothetical protein
MCVLLMIHIELLHVVRSMIQSFKIARQRTTQAGARLNNIGTPTKAVELYVVVPRSR